MNVAFGSREARPLQQMQQSVEDGWEGLEKMFSVDPDRPQANQPSDEVAKALAMGLRFSRERAVIEWLMDITIRQPFRATGKTLEETALRAANRQGIEGVGEVILAAIERGQTLIDQEEQRVKS